MRAKRSDSTAEKVTMMSGVKTESPADSREGSLAPPVLTAETTTTPPSKIRKTSPHMILNEMGIEEEADEEAEPVPKKRAKKSAACTTPEENKNPNGAQKQKSKSESREGSSSAHSGSFSPPPPLSPAYSLTEEVKMEVESEEDEQKEQKVFRSPKKPPTKKEEPKKSRGLSRSSVFGGGMRKVESSPALGATSTSEKAKYKRKDKDAVPYIDPNAPKRNRSAYVHFIISRRSAYSKATMSQRDINIALAADWQKLNGDERTPFHKAAEEEKARYLLLMEDYKKTDSHREFQKKRGQFLKTQGKKRKHGDDSDDDENASSVQMAFPKTAAFCPLLLNPSSSESSSNSGALQYSGPIFTPEFVAYNKTRDSYRRQLAIERSNVEHELEALHEHDLEIRIQKQEQRIRSLDENVEGAMKVMRAVFGCTAAAKDHLSDIDSLTEWLQTVTRLGAREGARKAVRESLQKYCKSAKK
ncbi:unnamed protein product [Caenorhabditis sp. 36 PRJEB53466]|nr:unnamed protein product [Caenorhabditis sp. 36 PRJEB53466]